MKSILKCLGVLATTLVLNATAEAAEKPFKAIMQNGFKGSKTQPPLLKKVIGGSATAEEKAQLAAYIKKLPTLKPKKGDAASWMKKTTALVTAVEKDDLKALKEASNCKACHSVHK